MPNAEIDSKSELYDKYAAALYGIILKVCPDRERAGEILHGVFRKICRETCNTPSSDCRPFTRILRLLIDQCEESLQRQKSDLVAIIFPLTNCQPETQFKDV